MIRHFIQDAIDSYQAVQPEEFTLYRLYCDAECIRYQLKRAAHTDTTIVILTPLPA